MSETAWAHLPNARLIDEILADFTARPQVWDRAWFESYTFGRAAAWSEARDAARRTEKSAAHEILWFAIWHRALGPTSWNAAWRPAKGASYALAVWPSSADLLPLTPDALRTIIDTCDGAVKHQAVLLLPAVIARSRV